MLYYNNEDCGRGHVCFYQFHDFTEDISAYIHLAVHQKPYWTSEVCLFTISLPLVYHWIWLLFVSFLDLLQTLPSAMATLRDMHGLCPSQVLSFILDLFKYNDNSKKQGQSCRNGDKNEDEGRRHSYLCQHQGFSGDFCKTALNPRYW